MADQDTYVSTLCAKSVEKAEVELNEKPATRGKALDSLRKRVKEHPGLTCPTDNAFLLRFLRARKFDEERTMQLILQHFRVKNEFYEELFKDFRPSSVKPVINLGVTNVLPDKDSEGRTVLWVRLGLWKPDVTAMLDLFKADIIAMQQCLDDEETQVNGFAVILDFDQFGMSQALHMTPSVAKKIYGVIQDAWPARLKALHHVNEPIVISYIFPIMRPFMKEKLVKRLFFHGSSYSELHKHFLPDILPSELGGTLADFEKKRQLWVAALLAAEDKFVELEKYKLVEDAPGQKGQSVKGDALQVMTGTFRKLNVD